MSARTPEINSDIRISIGCEKLKAPSGAARSSASDIFSLNSSRVLAVVHSSRGLSAIKISAASTPTGSVATSARPKRSRSLAPGTTAKGVSRNLNSLQVAREKLERAAPEFAEHIRRAAKVAARKGDSKPAEWALLHTRSVAPVAPAKPTAERDDRVIVQIGVKVCGVNDREP
jgi:hypothetical protein